jgi:broad specificity polyphosphatase/5'/3'-nucleotidase SurE
MKLLVIASEPITADDLRAVIGADATDDAEVMVIAPALHKSALRFWLSDADQAIARAQTVQQDSVDQLGTEGIAATGDTGESEPLAAIADTLEGFPADRIALFIHPQSEQSYRENITAAEITERFGLPVTATEIKR